MRMLILHLKFLSGISLCVITSHGISVLYVIGHEHKETDVAENGCGDTYVLMCKIENESACCSFLLCGFIRALFIYLLFLSRFSQASELL